MTILHARARIGNVKIYFKSGCKAETFPKNLVVNEVASSFNRTSKLKYYSMYKLEYGEHYELRFFIFFMDY